MEKNCEDCVHALRTVDDFPCCDCHRYERFEDANGIPQPSKTLLDEFAMAAMAGSDLAIWSISGKGGLADNCYEVAAAMIKERARRDEMGNVKEVK